MRKAIFLTLLLLAGCGKPQPPTGKWEGGASTGTLQPLTLDVTVSYELARPASISGS